MTPDATNDGRPVLHFTPQRGWINDPYGLTWYRGEYHLFFQYVPDQVDWAVQQHWGHATSPDLLHWTTQRVALSPGDGDDGIWSGSLALTEDGPATIFYTSVNLPRLDVAVARTAHPLDDEWQSWEKGPVVASVDPDSNVTTYRDPYVFHDGTTWKMIMGAGFADGRPAILGYSSGDLAHWQYDGIVAEGTGNRSDELWLGEGWECPQLFPIEDRWALVVGVWESAGPHYVAYALGDYADGRFIPDSWHRLSYGPSYYAASTFMDRDRRRGLIYWLKEVTDRGGQWAGAHSLPHTLALVNDRLVARPHPNIDNLRHDRQTATNGSLDLPALADVEWTLDSPESNATLSIGNNENPELVLCAERGVLRAETEAAAWEMPVSDGETLRIIVDGPIVEIFGAAGVLALPVSCGGSRRIKAEGSITWYDLG